MNAHKLNIFHTFLIKFKQFSYFRENILNFMEKSLLIKTRKKLGFSCKEIADLLCIEEYSYRRRENGKTKISNQEWKKLASILSVPFETIFEEEKVSIDTPQSSTSKINTTESYNIPKEMFDNQQEYITILKIENDTLKKENKFLKEKLLNEKKNKQ
jgi:transcriptional regulator with XRE-family HTH domain